MANPVFPTGYTHGVPGLATTLYGDDGTTNVYYTMQDVVGLALPSVPLSGATTLSFAAHHRRDLNATASMTLTVPVAATLTDGFRACVYTGAGQTITLSGTVYDLAGALVTTIPPSTALEIKVWGGAVYGFKPGSGLPSATTSQLYGGTGAAGTAQALTLGTGFSLVGTTLSATGGSGSGTVSAGTTGTLGYYAANGTTLSPLTVGAGLYVFAGTITGAVVPGGTTSQLLGASGTSGTANLVTVGSGLSLAAGTLTATGAANPTPRIITAAGPVTVLAGDGLVVLNKTVGAATTVTLEASPVAGVAHRIKDGKGDAGTNNITVQPAAGTIDGAATFVMNTNRQAITVEYTGAEWSIT